MKGAGASARNWRRRAARHSAGKAQREVGHYRCQFVGRALPGEGGIVAASARPLMWWGGGTDAGRLATLPKGAMGLIAAL